MELVSIDSPLQTLENLINFLDHPDWEYSLYEVKEALNSIGKNLALEPLLDALDKENSKEKRIHAIWCLGELRNPQAIEVLMVLLKDQDMFIESQAVQALIKFGLLAANPLIA
jgi:HEAT repeat protein